VFEEEGKSGKGHRRTSALDGPSHFDDVNMASALHGVPIESTNGEYGNFNLEVGSLILCILNSDRRLNHGLCSTQRRCSCHTYRRCSFSIRLSQSGSVS